MVTKKNPSAKKPVPKKKSAPSKKAPVSKRKAAAKRKSASPKKKSQKKNNQKINNWTDKIVTYLTTTLFVVFGLFIAYILLHPKNPEKVLSPKTVKTTPAKKVIPLKIAQFEKPDFEIYPAIPVPSRRAELTPKKVVNADGRPMVAIIIDDFGYDMGLAKKFMALNATLTCSILPQSVYYKKIALLAKDKGYEVLLHLPMEPNEYPLIDPGPGALLTAMTPDERIAQLKINIDSIPGVCGVNNHMGSKMTTLSDQMNQIFTVLKKRGLFFIDSRTTAATMSRSSARLFKVPYSERDVFLDHVRTEASIKEQIERLVNIAEIHGKAVGIGHPHEVTYKVLKKALPDIEKRVLLVPASEIVEVL